MGDSASEECSSCLCEFDPVTAVYCDADCWALIGCVRENCEEQPGADCIMQNCLDHAAGVGSVTYVNRPEVREACGAVCPLPMQ
jgi:hypothetical protein